jgi:cytochrome b561
MQTHRAVTRYSTGSKRLHWLIAILVILMLSFSFFLKDLADSVQPTAYMIHKSFGLTVLALMLVRIVWIIRTGKPELPTAIPTWERMLSRIVQYGFYVLLIAMPICGWITSVAGNRIPVYFGLLKVPIPGLVPNEAVSHVFDIAHITIAWILIVFITLHVAGALKHYLVDKDKILQRMLP